MSAVAARFQNPLNMIVGRLFQQLRHAIGIRNAAGVAQVLGISASTYRLVEAGRVPLPAYCTIELAQLFGLSVQRLAVLLSIVSTLNGPKLDAVQLRRRAARLAELDADLGWIAASIDDWLAAAGRGAPERRLLIEERVLIRINRFVRGAAAAGSATPAAANLIAESAARLPPILHDPFEEWLAQYASYTPVIAFGPLYRWFADRAARMKRIRTYLTDALGVAHLTRNEHMIRDFLQNDQEPAAQVAVEPDAVRAVGSAVRAVVASGIREHPLLGPTQRAHRRESLGRNIVIRAVDSGFRAAMRAVQAARLPGNAATLSDRAGATTHKDLWMLDYVPLRNPHVVRSVAFIVLYERSADAAEPGTRVSGYALALDHATTRVFTERFDAEWARIGGAP